MIAFLFAYETWVSCRRSNHVFMCMKFPMILLLLCESAIQRGQKLAWYLKEPAWDLTCVRRFTFRALKCWSPRCKACFFFVRSIEKIAKSKVNFRFKSKQCQHEKLSCMLFFYLKTTPPKNKVCLKAKKKPPKPTQNKLIAKPNQNVWVQWHQELLLRFALELP